MSLQEEIDKTRREIKTDSYSMSVGELISLYEEGDLEINQNSLTFKWSNQRKSAFIESILMGIPISAILVNQRHDGIWEVIDGLQRLSAIYEFLGILKIENSHQYESFTMLQDTIYLPSLNGKKWNDENDPENSLTPTQRLLIKRAKIAVNIILADNEKMIYELFRRLNSS
jgi:hypothetical protein